MKKPRFQYELELLRNIEHTTMMDTNTITSLSKTYNEDMLHPMNTLIQNEINQHMNQIDTIIYKRQQNQTTIHINHIADGYSII